MNQWQLIGIATIIFAIAMGCLYERIEAWWKRRHRIYVKQRAYWATRNMRAGDYK